MIWPGIPSSSSDTLASTGESDPLIAAGGVVRRDIDVDRRTPAAAAADNNGTVRLPSEFLNPLELWRQEKAQYPPFIAAEHSGRYPRPIDASSSGDPMGAGLTGSADLSCLVEALRRICSFCLLDRRLPEGGGSPAARMKLATGTCHRPESRGDIAEQDRSFDLHVLGVAARGARGSPNGGSGRAPTGASVPERASQNVRRTAPGRVANVPFGGTR